MAQPPLTDRPVQIIVDLLLANISVQAMIDTGSELDLIKTRTALAANLQQKPLTKPIAVRMALHGASAERVIIKHFVNATLQEACSGLSFKDVPLRVGHIDGEYDMILGMPFLYRFDLAVLSQKKAVQCLRTSILLHNYRTSHETSVAGIAPSADSTQEKVVLTDFADLFPADIPAVSDEAEEAGLFTNGTFPSKIQNENSPDDSPAALTAWIKLCKGAWADARDALWTSRVKQARQHNKHRGKQPDLRPDDWALLNSADWRGKHQRGTDKLKERFEGPYQVMKIFNHGLNTKLALPANNKQHPVFHISKLKHYIFPPDEDPLEPLPPDISTSPPL
ncbi:hypothetical protein PTTG_11384 [Puccinia triticina 1-1 BBBD Race 1]|uniref:Tf2-1-like SH3-like domain-containing protein n=1 Tax=Puccinia triticina (isolate 1-1 / race 1 (BBBD)) TaxID=630390 RepID=A0A180FZZ2_PUCT1|nr:hypothetical protein PTTG_11384 [Puccinia triticina 1-1 BBBD Race 1]